VSGSTRALYPVRPDDDDEFVNTGGGASSGGAAVEVVDPEGATDEGEHPAEEARAARPARDPRQPTVAERAAHEATHLPFRVWCAECVAGRRDNPPHRASKEAPTVPEIGMDYAFVRRADEEATLTLLVMKDRGSRAVRAWVVPHKGADLETAVERAADGVREFGHRGQIVLKVDNEPALLALREAVMAKLPGGAIPVQSPPGESQSNGGTENGVKWIKGILRVHLFSLERKVAVRFPSAHPVVAWLVEHVSDVGCKYLVGADGRTPYERLFGKKVREEALEFGEVILYRPRTRQDANVLLEPRWCTGVWLGRRWGSMTHRIYADGQVVDARAVQRVPLEERWVADRLAAIRATPWCLDPGPDGATVLVLPPLPVDPAAGPAPAPAEIEYRPRRVFIRKEDLERWGYTAGCRRCVLTREGHQAQGINHKPECRARIEHAMQDAGDERLTRAEDRRTKDMVRRFPEPPPLVAPAAEAQGEESVEGPQQEAPVVEVPVDADSMIDFLGAHVPVIALPAATVLYELFLVQGTPAREATAKIVELYSAPRVTKELISMPTFPLAAGSTFDLRRGADGKSWDFTQACDRAAALRQIRSERPALVIGSPPCTMFSRLNINLNAKKMGAVEWARRRAEAMVHLRFAVQVYQEQLRCGRHFLHEHPLTATSWSVPEVLALRARLGVGEVVADLCQFGLRSPSLAGESCPAKKPTRFLSSCPAILQNLGQRCRGGHSHVRLLGGRAAAAAIYPPGLCRAVLRGLGRQMADEGKPAPPGLVAAVAKGRAVQDLSACGPTLCEVDATPMQVEARDDRVGDEQAELQQWGGQTYWDENSGEVLPPNLTQSARREELAFMREWHVWDVVPVSECVRVSGKQPLGGRWVDVNKGDRGRPDVRSRYVAKDFAGGQRSDEFFAATPPLEALRLLLSHVASHSGALKVEVIDARKAHLHAFVDRAIFVHLPPEEARPGWCARLLRCLYGTRDAPKRWEAFLADELRKLGFTQGRASPCCFQHSARDLRCVVHGDDFVFAGPPSELDWARAATAKCFLTKVVGRLGGGAGEVRELRILNRVVRWADDGLRYEADPRHAEIVARGLGAVRAASAPGTASRDVHPSAGDLASSVPEDLARLYRSYAARANYLAMDRADIAQATKELCRRMREPTWADVGALRRVAAYLAGSPRLVYEYLWQSAGADIQVFADTDYAGCVATRRSTSGGCMMRGTHLIKHWSSTQRTVTLSSGEAELLGIVRGCSEALGARSLAGDLGMEAQISVCGDSSAAIGICRRVGIGKVRHLAVGQLWVQGLVRSGELRLHKVLGTTNPADALTKPLARPALDCHLASMHLQREAGRAASAPAATAELDTRLSASAPAAAAELDARQAA